MDAWIRRSGVAALLALSLLAIAPGIVGAAQPAPAAQPEPAAQAETAEHRPGGEANLVLPDLGQTDVGGYSGRTLLLGGLVVAAFGVLFGLIILTQIKNLPVHRSMLEISELIYETCKTYLITQGKFIAILEIFIAVVIVLLLRHDSRLERPPESEK